MNSYEAINNFISCDWGTSSFRLRLINSETQIISAEVKTSQGIAHTYKTWKNSGLERFFFYSSLLADNIKTLEKECGYTLGNLTVVLSGMASSGIGMMELAYKELPLKTDGSDLLVSNVAPSFSCRNAMIIISGIRSSADVIRGEETIIAGCNINKEDNDQTFIFPGTHSKHVIVNNGIIMDFKTYMTGEFFDLLSTKSILSSSVEKVDATIKDDSSFEEGVIKGSSLNFLHQAFMVRTNHLFNKLTLKQNYDYLSGLLIGLELKDLSSGNCASVTLVSSETFNARYLQALNITGIREVKIIEADKALIKGQCDIYKQYH